MEAKYMKSRLWVVGGSIGAAVLILLAIVPTIVGAQAIKTNKIQTSIVQQIKEKMIKTDRTPTGIIIDSILIVILMILSIIDAWLSGHLTY
jgi:UPF0716 family protein affecting phage T7 exclusion